MRRVLTVLGLTLAAASASSCGDGVGPVAGVLIVSLATPNPGADGAILLTVSGPGTLTSVSAEPGLRVFSVAFGTTNNFAVTGQLTNGAILTIGVPDTRRASQYVATIQRIAASDYTLRGAAGYSLTIAP
jgi:hypothetical protein